MFLSEDEAGKLIDRVQAEAETGGLPSFIDRLIIETLLHSGLRNSEFCRLRLGDFAAGHPGPALRIADDPAGRSVYLPQSAAELIRRFVSEFRPDLLPPYVSRDDPAVPLILHERRRPFERAGLYRRVVRILTRAGLGERASVQLLRHTYGYLAYLRTGGNLLFVQRQLGHAHPVITSIYARFVDESYTDLAERVAGHRSLPAVGGGLARPNSPPSRPLASAVEEFQSEYD